MCDVKGRGKKVKMPILVKDCRKKVGAKWSLGYNRITIKKITSKKKRREEGKRERERERERRGEQVQKNTSTKNETLNSLKQKRNTKEMSHKYCN